MLLQNSLLYSKTVNEMTVCVRLNDDDERIRERTSDDMRVLF